MEILNKAHGQNYCNFWHCICRFEDLNHILWVTSALPVVISYALPIWLEKLETRVVQWVYCVLYMHLTLHNIQDVNSEKVLSLKDSTGCLHKCIHITYCMILPYDHYSIFSSTRWLLNLLYSTNKYKRNDLMLHIIQNYCRTGIFRKRAIFGIRLIWIFRKVNFFRNLQM